MGRNEFKCPRCGSVVTSPVKTWHIFSPLPDSKGRITITIMGIFVCPNCGYKWRAAVNKLKVGGESIEIKGKVIQVGETQKKREGQVIELSLEELLREEEE